MPVFMLMLMPMFMPMAMLMLCFARQLVVCGQLKKTTFVWVKRVWASENGVPRKRINVDEAQCVNNLQKTCACSTTIAEDCLRVFGSFWPGIPVKHCHKISTFAYRYVNVKERKRYFIVIIIFLADFLLLKLNRIISFFSWLTFCF